MIEIKRLSFGYGSEKAIDGIDLRIGDGEFVLLTGPSGSGKTTLARCLNGLIPNFYGGRLAGSVLVDGKEATKAPTKEMAKRVGFVFQDPESMFVSDDVEGEVSFGPSCLGVKCSVKKVLSELSIEGLQKRSLRELSGGEKQKVAIASVLVMKPDILILDEPFSELDHGSAEDLTDFLKRLNREGMTIILIEQRPVDCARREIAMEGGRIVYDGPPRRNGAPIGKPAVKSGDILVKFDKVSFSYGENSVLKNLSQDFREGELVVLQGPNGSGKTTLLKLVMGLLEPVSGTVNVGGLENPGVEELAGAVGYVFQNPDNHLFAETVEEEINFILKNTGKTGDVDEILKRFKISKHKKDYPRYLSGGEKQRVALASILVAGPKVLLLDEPTRGMDHDLKKELGGFLKNYVAKSNLVIMATHDDYMASCATRRVLM